MPTEGEAAIVYPFGRFGAGYRVEALDAFVDDIDASVCKPLRRAAWCLFLLSFALTVALSTRHWGGPYISAQTRPIASTLIVFSPIFVFFTGRRLWTFARVRGRPQDAYLGRIFVWANLDNAFGAAVKHPQGALVVAPWLDAGRKYRLDVIDEPTARRIIWGSIALECTSAVAVCAVLIFFYGQATRCIYGVSLYYSISQPVLAGIELHVLMPMLTQVWHPRTFDDDVIIAQRYRWLRIFVMGGIYMSALLFTRLTQRIPMQAQEPIEIIFLLAAYATASSYALLAFICLTKTWIRPWSVGSVPKAILARALFLIACLCLAASMMEPLRPHGP